MPQSLMAEEHMRGSNLQNTPLVNCIVDAHPTWLNTRKLDQCGPGVAVAHRAFQRQIGRVWRWKRRWGGFGRNNRRRR